MTPTDIASDPALCQTIADLFSARLNVTVPSQDTDLFAAGLLDSVAFIDLLMHLEQQFGIRCSLEELELDDFRTVARIASMIRSWVATAGVDRAA